MPVDADNATTHDELLDKLLPELIASEEAPHSCVYRTLLGKFVAEDLRNNAITRLDGEQSFVFLYFVTQIR
jgi:hypothetical protein